MPRLGEDRPELIFESVNSQRRWSVLDLCPRLLKHPLYCIVLLGIAMYFVVIVIFAVLMHACGQSCYSIADPRGFHFEEMLWLSAHTFTTVGFGSSYPTCGAAQFVVVLEQYVSLLCSSTIGAFFLLHFFQPRSLIRFATSALFSFSEDDCHLHIRVANDTRYAIQHITAHVRAMINPHDHHGTAGRSVLLPLLADSKAHLTRGEHWVLTHVLDVSSVLATAMAVRKVDSSESNLSDSEIQQILKDLYWVDVMINAFDPIYAQEVKFHKRYTARDLITHARWVDMLRWETISRKPNGKAEKLRVINDHRFMDDYVLEEVAEKAHGRMDETSNHEGTQIPVVLHHGEYDYSSEKGSSNGTKNT